MPYNKQLISYLPPVLQKILEFKQISNSQQPEFDAAWEAFEEAFDNCFLELAREKGIESWEQELGFKPDGSLDVRKQRIKTAWRGDVVYDKTWIKKWLGEICGSDGFEYSLLTNTYLLRLVVPAKVDYAYVFDTLRQLIPGNIHIEPGIRLSDCSSRIYSGVYYTSKISITYKVDELVES